MRWVFWCIFLSFVWSICLALCILLVYVFYYLFGVFTFSLYLLRVYVCFFSIFWGMCLICVYTCFIVFLEYEYLSYFCMFYALFELCILFMYLLRACVLSLVWGMYPLYVSPTCIYFILYLGYVSRIYVFPACMCSSRYFEAYLCISSFMFFIDYLSGLFALDMG